MEPWEEQEEVQGAGCCRWTRGLADKQIMWGDVDKQDTGPERRGGVRSRYRCIVNTTGWMVESVTVDTRLSFIRHRAANGTLRHMNILEHKLILCME